MAELQKLLARQRSKADVESAVFDGSNYQSRDEDVGRLSINGRDAQQVLAFRSGWTQQPKFHDWSKPKFGGGDAQHNDDAESSRKYTTSSQLIGERQGVGAPSTDCSSLNLSAAPLANSDDVVSVMSVPSPSKAPVPFHGSTSEKNQEHHLAQKERLDKLLATSLAENQKLDRLLAEAKGDSDQQAEQIHKLLDSKAQNEQIITQTQQALTQLQETLVRIETERDSAVAAADSLRTEKQQLQDVVTSVREQNLILEGREASAREENQRLEDLVANVRKENLRLEAVVDDLTKEKKELQVVAARGSAIEIALAEARAMSAQLQQKADGAERLQKLLDIAGAEKARLERLLATSNDGHEALQKQILAVEANYEQVKEQNAKLQEALRDREKVEEISKRLGAENERLKHLAQDAEARATQSEEVVEQLTQQNLKLERKLQEAELAAGLRAMGLEGRIKTLEIDKDSALQALEQERKEMKALLAESTSSREAERSELLQQLAEARRENESLKLQVQSSSQSLKKEAGISQSERGSSQPQSLQATPSKLSESAEISTSAFGSLLDSWLSVLSGANEEAIVAPKTHPKEDGKRAWAPRKIR